MGVCSGIAPDWSECSGAGNGQKLANVTGLGTTYKNAQAHKDQQKTFVLFVSFVGRAL